MDDGSHENNAEGMPWMWDIGCWLGRSTSIIFAFVEVQFHLKGLDKLSMGEMETVAADIKIILANLTSVEDQQVKFDERLSKVKLSPPEQAKSQTENDDANQDVPRVEVGDNSNIHHSQQAADQQQLRGRDNGAAYP